MKSGSSRLGYKYILIGKNDGRSISKEIRVHSQKSARVGTRVKGQTRLYMFYGMYIYKMYILYGMNTYI